jgi:hypothetical protein
VRRVRDIETAETNEWGALLSTAQQMSMRDQGHKDTQ